MQRICAVSGVYLDGHQSLTAIRTCVSGKKAVTSSTAAGSPGSNSSRKRIIRVPSTAPKHSNLARHRQVVLARVHEAITTHNCPPSIHRVKRIIKLADPSDIGCRLGTLRQGNCVQQSPRHPHTLRILLPSRLSSANDNSSEPAPQCMPLIKQVTTNNPVLTRRSIRDIFPLPTRLINSKRLFLLGIVNSSVIRTTVYSNS